MAAIGFRAEGILRLVGDYHDAVDASLQYACGGRDPIAECIRGEISLRQLGVLIEYLPYDSPAVIANRGNNWGVTDWLLREVANEQRITNAAIYNLTREKGKPALEPEMIPAPEENESIEESLESMKEREQQARVKAEMDEHVLRIFANPN